MALASGSKIGHYEILAPLGAGGMGEVYRARDPRLNREVAIKILPGEAASDPDRLRRFEQEARAAGALHNANILTIHDVGRHEGTPYVVSELLEGETLRQRLGTSPLPTREALEYGVQIARGLAAAHEKGIIHRDLKPENLFVTHDGPVKILDFGLAKVQRPEPPGTESETATRGAPTIPGTVMGTVGYMSPEQVRGRAVDHRSDVFSLGAVVYEMLSGERAFRGDTSADITTAILTRDPPPLSAGPRDIPAGLERLVSRCLQKKAEERFQSVRDVAFALESIAADEQGPAAVEARTAHDSPDVPSIAVLPFADMSPQKDQDYFCEGMAEEIISALVQVKGLRVAARTASSQFKGKADDHRRVGKALGVSTFLEGSVRTAGDRLRVTAQLIDVHDGFHIWSERYDRKMQDIFEIQDEIARQIVTALEVGLGHQAPPRIKRYTDDLETYHLYMKGRYIHFQRHKGALQQAVSLFRQVIEREPTHAPAHALLGWCYLVTGLYGFLPPSRAYSEGKMATERAVFLDDSHPDVQVGLWGPAFMYEWNWEKAERQLRHAVQQHPTHIVGRAWNAVLMASLGRYEEALREVKRAQELDPLSLYANNIAGMVHMLGGHRRAGIPELLKVLDLDPDNAVALYLLGMIYSSESMHERALAALEKVATLYDRASFYLAWLGWACAAAGETSQAREILQELSDRSEKEYVSPLCFAWLHSALGNEDEAFVWLEAAREDRSPYLALWRLPAFDTMRRDPRFQDVLRRMGLPPRLEGGDPGA